MNKSFHRGPRLTEIPDTGESVSSSCLLRMIVIHCGPASQLTTGDGPE